MGYHKTLFRKVRQKVASLFLGCIVLCTCTLRVHAQTGNYVPSGAEVVNSGTISLSTPGGQTWTTARGATPGYYVGLGTGTYIGASDASHINGYVKHRANVANQAFSFPVGSGTDYRSLSVSGTRDANSVIATAWIQGDPSTTADPTDTPTSHPVSSKGTGITSVSTIGQWDWLVESGSNSGMTVTVSIPDLSTFGAASDLRLVGWDGTAWVNLSANQGASNNTENSTLSGTMISGITALGIGLAGAVAGGSITCAKTQLIPAPVTGVASQVTLLVTINLTAEGTFSPISVSGSGMSLANGISSVIAVGMGTGSKTFSIPLNYNGSALSSVNFTIGSAGSCTADLTQASKQMVANVWTMNNCIAVVPGTISK
ncbi:hypothetical protein GOQ04_24940 [Emticicia sp. ODNR4P]|nr:hypothetical protein [Emticicia sp. ODNR4P]